MSVLQSTPLDSPEDTDIAVATPPLLNHFLSLEIDGQRPVTGDSPGLSPPAGCDPSPPIATATEPPRRRLGLVIPR
ncbi:hypothetical protein SKAU_G00356670 [Synaphobranchus kaupii]|uniref:Uncharacterized protein n=1 Tax=Synaphobranchus kaupii TaxID=118154 RepID=A0A9Q1IGN7_SYNKA|nr:hypothetical protein SKAU_G00356670 [Synaphobranchus kaupii]